MNDDLQAQLQRLVHDPPPPSVRPSEAVFARVRKVRRRRTAGVVVLATAAVAAVFAISNNLTGIDAQPPVLGPPSPVQSASTSPAPYYADVTLKPVVYGRTVTMNISATGRVLLPIGDGNLELPKQQLFGLSQGSAYSWGDDSDIFSSFANGSECVKAKTPVVAKGTLVAETHTYKQPGTYTYTYRVRFCGLRTDATKSVQVTIS